MIEVKNIVQAYGKNTVLDGVSIKLKERAVTALIGANGAGKSTLIGVIARLIPFISGSVMIDGEELGDIKTREIAKKIAILKQTQSLGVRVSVEELVEFGRFPHCGGRLRDTDREKIEEAIAYMDLAGIRGKYIDELSGGQKQRAFIAMILAQDTPYIFLDEPLNNLDIKYSVEMMKIIRSLVRDLKKTVVVVLHDINFAAAYSDYVVAMKDGKIINCGRTEDIVTKDVLDYIFDHDFNITEHEGKKVCLYYDKRGGHDGGRTRGHGRGGEYGYGNERAHNEHGSGGNGIKEYGQNGCGEHGECKGGSGHVLREKTFRLRYEPRGDRYEVRKRRSCGTENGESLSRANRRFYPPYATDGKYGRSYLNLLRWMESKEKRANP
jgi:iron complex transport system ATP-binding protein